MKQLKSLVGIVLFLAIATFVVFQVLNFLSGNETATQKAVTKITKKVPKKDISIVAVGDSLTEGIGDGTATGGYVSRIADLYAKDKKINDITTANYGISGNTSTQILKRIQTKTDIQDSLKEADVIVLTFGGNDLMKVIKSQLLKVTEDSFTKPEAEYKERVKTIFSEIRNLNKHAPIYVYGIYNPFYLYFSDVPEMQAVVDSWNEATTSVVDEQNKAHFIPINDLLSKGNQVETTKKEEKASKNSDQTPEIVNDLLFEEDSFHPNDEGYDRMAKALYEKMQATKTEWLP
ncbi:MULTISPECIES: SGNH/GDSL hydrolase family protein [Carnobacterium]|uniref:SGNH/GDSL hydrolase family protein n=1 Tax=Carnobacterium TaxID=2747 RepID=UPI0007F3FDE5|nr:MULTISPECIES: SGNH/GDSL hydrolase family protein [Carnobacterium]MDT1938888.1 SGNH/GDSL hydrolase family protein [Carnobacterium divergens]MDT1941326.1 SGNH/GDSL hydrolase family protein [Carnobacterium divergens]MDT1947124.1 SGNH/GDSL hydrolase family protein [Carnobacterium divergens]MDT1949562.1 SGNH/GDSL hydrolase family protein [Carnobacterium divergens]MDT1954740.1 SGNH/GDSL hydrolase family protein [Carnobacterium divergens]